MYCILLLLLTITACSQPVAHAASAKPTGDLDPELLELLKSTPGPRALKMKDVPEHLRGRDMGALKKNSEARKAAREKAALEPAALAEAAGAAAASKPLTISNKHIPAELAPLGVIFDILNECDTERKYKDMYYLTLRSGPGSPEGTRLAGQFAAAFFALTPLYRGEKIPTNKLFALYLLYYECIKRIGASAISYILENPRICRSDGIRYFSSECERRLGISCADLVTTDITEITSAATRITQEIFKKYILGRAAAPKVTNPEHISRNIIYGLSSYVVEVLGHYPDIIEHRRVHTINWHRIGGCSGVTIPEAYADIIDAAERLMFVQYALALESAVREAGTEKFTKLSSVPGFIDEITRVSESTSGTFSLSDSTIEQVSTKRKSESGPFAELAPFLVITCAGKLSFLRRGVSGGCITGSYSATNSFSDTWIIDGLIGYLTLVASPPHSTESGGAVSASTSSRS